MYLQGPWNVFKLNIKYIHVIVLDIIYPNQCLQLYISEQVFFFFFLMTCNWSCMDHQVQPRSFCGLKELTKYKMQNFMKKMQLFFLYFIQKDSDICVSIFAQNSESKMILCTKSFCVHKGDCTFNFMNEKYPFKK